LESKHLFVKVILSLGGAEKTSFGEISIYSGENMLSSGYGPLHL